MAKTQNFFTNAISVEIEKLNNELTPEFQDLVVDALFQIELLDQNYNKLKQDLTDSGNDKRVINAMISNFQDRIDILEYRPESTVHFYKCDGYQNYMYGYMVPSTGYLSNFKLRSYEIGFIIQYPRAEAGSKIPRFVDAPKYVDTLRKASVWADVVEASSI